MELSRLKAENEAFRSALHHVKCEVLGMESISVSSANDFSDGYRAAVQDVLLWVSSFVEEG